MNGSTKNLSTKKIVRVGLDLAKRSIAVHAVDRDGRRVFARALKPEELLPWFDKNVRAQSVVGMEACAGAHDWARRLMARGYAVRLMAPKPYAGYRARN